MVLMRSDQCPCWAGYPKGNSECINMNSVLLWMLLPVLFFTSSPDHQSWTRIWQKQRQKLFSSHHALCNSSVLRGWDSKAYQLRVPSRSRWPRVIMTAPLTWQKQHPGGGYLQQEDVDFSSEIPSLHTMGLWASFWLCCGRGPTDNFGKRLVLRVDKMVPLQCDTVLGCLRGVFQESFCYISWVYHLLLGLVYLSLLYISAGATIYPLRWIFNQFGNKVHKVPDNKSY